MIPQNEARIFLAQNRTIIQLDCLKSWDTFTTNDNSDLINHPFLKLKDNVLAPGNSLKIEIEDNADVMLLAVAGTIVCKIDNKIVAVDAGEAQTISLKQKDSIEIFNTYEDQFINFLELQMKPGYFNGLTKDACTAFDLDLNKNKLIRLFNNSSNNQSFINFYIGKFDGRQDTLYQILKPGNALFAFVIDGAFEVQYRLLETRDALMLWNLDDAGIEALSNNAVILLAEINAIRTV